MPYNYPTWKLILYAGLVFLIVYTSLLLATFKDVRQKTFYRMDALYSATFKGPEKVTVTRVDVPENKPAQVAAEDQGPKGQQAQTRALPRVAFKSNTARSTSKPDRAIKRQAETRAGPKGDGEAKPEPSLSGSRASDREEAAPMPKGKSQQEAYNMLLRENKPMADLVANANPNLKFKTWSVIESKGDTHLIKLVFLSTLDNSEVDYVWQVNPVSKEIVPMSYEARKLAVK